MTTPKQQQSEYPFAFIYNPAGDEEMQQWGFDPASWTVGEMAICERMYGKPRDEFLQDVNDGYVSARKILLWTIRRRTEPNISMDDIDELVTGDLGLFKLATEEELAALEEDDQDDDDEPEPDPEPDAVNDPKDGQSGRSATSSGKSKPPAKKSSRKPKPTDSSTAA